MENSKNQEEIFQLNHPISGAVFFIAESDMSATMKWQIDNPVAEELNPNWRLPTIDELEAIYKQLHLNGIGNFKNSHYWSGSEFSQDAAWYFNFETGEDGTGLKLFSMNVRLVRNSNPFQ